MKNPWILPAAALLVGGAGGFLAGKNGGSSQASSAPDSLSLSASRSNRSGSASTDNRANRAKSLADIRKTPGQNGRIQALLDYYQNLTPDQMEAEAAKLENMPMNERIMASILLFGRWAETDPKAALAFSDKMGMAGMFAKPTILQSWASVDPENAAKYFAENPREFQMMGMGGPGGRGGNSGASVIAGEWAKSDPQAALAWAESLQGRDKTQAMTAVVRELATSDPQKAVTMAAAMEGDAQKDAYASIASQWGAKDFTAAEAWIKSLPADQQASAMAEAIGSLANTDPQLASQKIASMADGREKQDAINSVVNSWSREDPKAAATWLLAQGGEDVSRNAMRDLMRNWSSQDDASAVAFISQQPSGTVRDEAATSYIWSNRSDNPQAVVSLAESITDERSRERAIAVSAERWMQSDPEAAKAYIQQSTLLSDEAKQRIQEGNRGGFGNRFGGGGQAGGNNNGAGRRRGN
ncbi:hypothetical protein [Luteolibacter sp. LG18]|uniref:hypothetical protein n=1 Tax=Luteolibacter sp. LG18 TaxID=2819286 RepID=UPI002B2840A9|nr:hypothetical protein llg_35070 [Luteolibacter sp. LG18]